MIHGPSLEAKAIGTFAELEANDNAASYRVLINITSEVTCVMGKSSMGRSADQNKGSLLQV